jgi:hypothetical protein
MTTITLVVALLAAQAETPVAEPSPPPSPPMVAPLPAAAPVPAAGAPVPLGSAAESEIEAGPKQARVRVTLLTEVKDAELYDVTRLATLCRAPCGQWLETDPEHPYQVRAAGVPDSANFTFQELQGEVEIKFTPRIEPLFGLGKAFTIIGAIGVAGGALAAIGWLIVIGVFNLLGALFSGLAGGGFSGAVGGFEVLYVAAIAAGAGAAFLTPGIIMMIKGRERLSVDVATGSATPLRP